MLNWLLSNWSWKGFALGAVAAFFGGKIARPALTEVVKTGMDVRDSLSGTWEQARHEVDRVRADAAELRTKGAGPATQAQLTVELQKLHGEIASLKAALRPRRSRQAKQERS